ncbi:sodium/potassium/calcium exchanger 3-like isoform X3 [Oncorhynchus nerka]|uniref:sodium/potassium/calcium exchanger 3-like isoform X3 n=1 Tax=Oncorhynchus nerka TaxID=8023 RepID=UPI0011325CA1|nr:sodium/potassium/calcium exchanger 3-like isoform X3 [Oncorhynchus nerka]
MKTAVQTGRPRPFQRFCCCGVGLLAVIWLSQFAHVIEPESSGSHSGEDGVPVRARRRLMQEEWTEDNQTLDLSRPAIHEFPEDIFTKEELKRGAVLLHVLCAIYMFYALAIVCDDYFVPSLEKISENLQLSEDVAGATFMAAGSSAPELFTSLIGVFITKGDVGVGTIVGSAVFNILVIIGVCGIFAGQTVVLTWWSLFRDSTYYIFSVLALILVIFDAKVVWWEAVLLMTMYGVYIVIMKFNSQLLGCVTRCFGGPGQCCLGSEGHRDEEMAEDGPACNTNMVLLRKGQLQGQEFPPVMMVDELLILNPHQLSFSEAGLRIMITPHFSPRTRLRMAGRMLISERQRLIRSPNSQLDGETSAGAGGTPLKGSGGLENGGSVERQTPEGAGLGDAGEKPGAEGCQAEEEEDDDGPFRPLHWPGMGDMAVSNSIGSNIFDILLGLGFPWALRTLVVDNGSSVYINNKGLVYSVVLLLASVFLTVMSVHLNHWKLDRRLGLGLIFLYAIFLLCSIFFGQM